jgi:hypothetical protein
MRYGVSPESSGMLFIYFWIPDLGRSLSSGRASRGPVGAILE